MNFEIKKEWQGRMGTNLTTTYEVYVDGEIVGFAKQKWLATAIGEAIVAGHIEATGDTTARFSNWAYTNAPDVFDRIVRVGA